MIFRSRRRFGAAAVAMLLLHVGASATAALVCGIRPDTPGIVDRTIRGEQPMGGDYPLVLVGRIADIEATPTDDGYREAVMTVEAVLRGTADTSWSFYYPAAEDDISPYMREGRRYLVALTLDADDRWVTSPCSATQELKPTDDVRGLVALAIAPTVYEPALLAVAKQEIPPLVLGGLIGVFLVVAFGLVVIARRPGHPKT
jgi:hypothetical protein